MIIIYNFRGLLFGSLGLCLAILLLAFTKLLTLGLVAMGVLWIVFGRSSSVDLSTGQKGPAPSVFFIPLFYWGILSLILAVPAMGIDYIIANTDFKKIQQDAAAHADPREARFTEEERRLTGQQTDDPELSNTIKQFMAVGLPGVPFELAIRTREGAVLILIQTPDLKRIKNDDRKLMLESIRKQAETHHPEEKIYIGLKGKLFYGAVSTPTKPMSVGSVVAKNPLYDFFGPQPLRNIPDAALEVVPGDAPLERPIDASADVSPADSGNPTANSPEEPRAEKN